MQTPVTIVMYHYVRKLSASKYPRIKALELEDFKQQLDYIERFYQVISIDDLISGDLPTNPAFLTFDDGYIDHYEYVLPELQKRKMTGAFFAPVGAVRDGDILDVNKIHFILASNEDLSNAIELMHNRMQEANAQDIDNYKKQYHIASRFDDANTAYFKRMLQFGLPEDLRKKITAEIFAKYVSADEKDFAKTLYLSNAQIKEMINVGMHFGGHGYAHNWLEKLYANAQQTDIEQSLNWLKSLGACEKHFTFCYPYGSYNSDTIEILKKLNCKAAFTTKVDLAFANDNNSMLELPRLDTNDLPKSSTAKANEWTQKCLS